MEPINYGKEKDNEIQLWFADKPYWNFYEFFNYSIMFKLIDDLKQFYKNCYDCEKFAKIIHETKKVEIANFMEIEKFKKIFGALVQIWQDGGISNSYITFFKWIFGEQTNVNINIVAPCCLDISISNYRKYFYRVLENRQEYRTTEDQTYYRVCFPVILDITTEKMLAYLKTFMPTNYFINFRFINN